MKKLPLLLSYLIVGLLLASCNLAGTATSEPESSTAEPLPTATPLPTSTPEPEFLYLQHSAGSELLSISPLAMELERLARESGLLFEQGNGDEPVPAQTSVLVTTAGPETLRALRVERPTMNIVALGVEGLEPTEGLTIIGPEGLRFDRASFMAGYLGAMLVSDHRIGMIASQDQPERALWQSAFTAGQEYYCGLCRTVDPPFEDYPIFITLPSNFDSSQASDQMSIMRQRAVKAVFLDPTINLSKLEGSLAGEPLIIFTSVEPNIPINGLAAVIRPSPEQVLIDLWPKIMAGEAPATVDIQFMIDRKDPNAISDARLDFAQQVLDDLNAGFITTTTETD